MRHKYIKERITTTVDPTREASTSSLEGRLVFPHRIVHLIVANELDLVTT
jgi:hypothetical protein